MKIQEEIFDDCIKELGIRKELFPRRLLKMLRRYFHYEHMLFVPCLYEKEYKEIRKRHAAIDNCMGLNIKMSDLQLYEQYAKYDPFAPAKLASDLRDKSFLTICDLMTFEQYEKSEYFQFVTKMGLYYQGSLMLKGNTGRIMAGLGIFKKKEEGDFTDEEKAILSRIADYASALYSQEILLSSTVQTFSMVEKYYKDSAIGVVLTDNRGMVLWSNSSARLIGKQYIREESDMILGKLDTFDDDIMEIQQVILDLGEELLGDEAITYSPILNRNYTFYSEPLSVSNIMGTKEGRYLIHVHKEAPKGSDYIGLVKSLTQRERQILESMLQGKSNEEIARQLKISENTIRTHISNIYRKVGVKNKSEIILKFIDEVGNS